MNKCPYEVFGISKTASESDIKKKHRELVKKFHPDLAPADKKEEYQKIMADINAANDILSNPEKKQKYDMFGNAEGMDGMDGMDMSGMGGLTPEMIAKMFGQHGSQPKKKSVKPINVNLNITLENAYNGKQHKMTIDRKSMCQTCEGTGSKNKQQNICKVCNGKGSVKKMIRQGPMIQQFIAECDNCNGSGSSVEKANICLKCKGNKMIPEKYDISFYINKGIVDGETIYIRDEGNPIDMYSRGKICITVHIKNHATFKRNVINKSSRNPYNPLNLSTIVKLSFAESICGFKKSIKHLDDHIIEISGSCVKHGDISHIVGEGMKNDDETGDLYIKYQVEDLSLSAEKRAAIYKIITGNEFTTVIKNSTPVLKTSNLEFLNDEQIAQINSRYSQQERHQEYDEENGGEASGCQQQ